MSDEQQDKVLTPEECKDLIDLAIIDANKLIIDRVKLAGNRQQWILYGRIVNVLWAHHYGPAYQHATQELIKSQDNIK